MFQKLRMNHQWTADVETHETMPEGAVVLVLCKVLNQAVVLVLSERRCLA
jgi:hypothetical protein